MLRTLTSQSSNADDQQQKIQNLESQVKKLQEDLTTSYSTHDQLMRLHEKSKADLKVYTLLIIFFKNCFILLFYF